MTAERSEQGRSASPLLDLVTPSGNRESGLCPVSQDPLELTGLFPVPEMGSPAPFLDTGPPCHLLKACLVHFCAWI